MGPNQREVKRRLRILKHAEKIGMVLMALLMLGVGFIGMRRFA